jgi:hypothetical protein
MTQTIPTATRTGTARRHHITGEKAPVVTLPPAPWCGGYGPGDVVSLDGEALYVFDVCGEQGLFREALAMDAGDNVVRRRTAPAGLTGIASPVLPRTHAPTLTTVGDGLVAWIR